MVITTIDLLNHLRCRRYAALDRLSQARRYHHARSDVRFAEFRHLGGIAGYSAVVDLDTDETAEIQKNRQYELTDAAVETMKEVVRTLVTKQRPDISVDDDREFTLEFHDGYRLAVRPDLFLGLPGSSEAITIVPMTSKEMRSLHYTLNKVKVPLFQQSLNGHWRPDLRDIPENVKSNYHEKLAKMTDRHTDLGRIVYDIAFKAFVFDRLFRPHGVRQLLVVLNHEYVHDGHPGEYSKDLIAAFDLTDLAKTMAETIEIDLYRMINHVELNDDSRCPLVKQECKRNQPFQCQYFEYCSAHLPKEHSVFHYFFQHQGFVESLPGEDVVHDTYELVNNGMVDMLDIPISWLKREKNLMQRYCVENDKPYVNQAKIKTYLDLLKFPVYYLDFEAYPAIVPRFAGESPYTQSVFQFSVHVQKTIDAVVDRNDPKTHFEWLATDGADRRREFVTALLQAIPPGDSSICVYNQTFERNRLIELAKRFPEHADRLAEIASRLFDLLKAVKNDYDFFIAAGFTKEAAETYNYYHPDLDGSYSLKKVLPVLGGADYEGMAIANGVQAYLAYARFSEMTDEARIKAIGELREYCKLDTFAMYLIVRGLGAQVA